MFGLAGFIKPYRCIVFIQLQFDVLVVIYLFSIANHVLVILDHSPLYRVTVPYAAYTGCPRRNVPGFGRVFLMLKYTDITQNTYVQILTITEIMARKV